MALKRDVYEKERYLEVIGLGGRQERGSFVFLRLVAAKEDGGDLLSTKGISQYVGVDFSSELIETARKHFSELRDDRFTLLVGKFQELDDVLKRAWFIAEI